MSKTRRRVAEPVGPRLHDEILRAIRGDEATCQAAGINVTFYKIASLVISAAFAGAGGAMYAHYQLQVSPQLFAVVTSITIITMVYVGGMASIYGPVGGAILLVLLTELLRNFGEWRLMIYSCALILILFFLPGGLVAPMWRRLRAAYRICNLASHHILGFTVKLALLLYFGFAILFLLLKYAVLPNIEGEEAYWRIKQRAIERQALASQGKHTPFSGYELPGRVRCTIAAGQLAFESRDRA